MMSTFRKYFLPILAACALVAQEAAPKPEDEADNLEITADSVEIEMEKHLITLDGNVLVTDADMQLTAKKMIAYLDDQKKLRSIEATDNVTVRRLKTMESATGDKGFYDAATDVVTLVGNCVLNKDKNTANGEKVIYERKSGNIRLLSAVITIPVTKQSSNALLQAKAEENASDDKSSETKAAPAAEPAKTDKEKTAEKTTTGDAK